MFVHNLPAAYVDNTRPVEGRDIYQHTRDWAQIRSRAWNSKRFVSGFSNDQK